MAGGALRLSQPDGLLGDGVRGEAPFPGEIRLWELLGAPGEGFASTNTARDESREGKGSWGGAVDPGAARGMGIRRSSSRSTQCPGERVLQGKNVTAQTRLVAIPTADFWGGAGTAEPHPQGSFAVLSCLLGLGHPRNCRERWRREKQDFSSPTPAPGMVPRESTLLGREARQDPGTSLPPAPKSSGKSHIWAEPPQSGSHHSTWGWQDTQRYPFLLP